MTDLDEVLVRRADASGGRVASAFRRSGVWEAAEAKARRVRRRRIAWRAGLAATGGFVAAIVVAPVLFGGGPGTDPALEPASGPSEIAGMSLACGEPMPDVTLVGSDRLLAGSRPTMTLVTNVSPMAPMPVVILKGGDHVIARVHVGGAEPGLTYESTVFQVFRGQIVSSATVTPTTGSGVASASALANVAVPLVPGECEEGEADPLLLERATSAESIGVGLEVHVAVVARDEGGHVVRHWLDPDGPVAYLPDLGPKVVDGWCPAA